MRLEHIQIENFLGARRVDVQLQKRVNIFAGANAAGKSSIQEAVRMALTREPVRVELKKEYGALLSEGAEGGFAEVTFDTGHAVVTLPNGKFNDYPMPAALPYVIDAQRFAHLPVNERRAFLFGLMGLKTDGEAVRKRLLDRGLDALKIDRVQSMLRAGFEPACKEAKAKATEAKGAWRAVTGETYGSEKVKTWHAPKPAFDAAAQAKAATELKHADVALESWQQTIGKLGAEEARRAALKAKLPALHDHAAMVQRFETKLGVDEASLADLDATIARTATAAGGGPRIGLVHDLARAIALILPAWPGTEQVHWDQVRAALDAYEKEHGKLDAAGDPDARAKLPALQDGRKLVASAVANDKRYLAEARTATTDAAAIAVELAAEFDAGALFDARKQAEALKAQRSAIVATLDTFKAAKAAVDAADAKTKEAAKHAADVAAWDALGDALAPSGIPAEMLSEALDPINERLMQSAMDAEWPRVGVEADMSISADCRAYALLSESEKWRTNAMLAEAIGFLSGVKLLVLDRFDVLDFKGRTDLLAWLDILASDGEIDSALLFGTLKALPAQLPDTIAAHWIDNGVCGQLQEAA